MIITEKIGKTHFSEIEILYDIVIYVGPYLSSNRIRPPLFCFQSRKSTGGGAPCDSEESE